MTIHIELPEPELRIKLNEDVTLRNKFKHIGWRNYFKSEKERDNYCNFYDIMIRVPKGHQGLYYLYDVNEELLYIGRTVNTRQRLTQHFWGSSNSSDFVHLVRMVDLIYIPDLTDQEIYEAYAIRELNPLYNVAKTTKTIKRSQ